MGRQETRKFGHGKAIIAAHAMAPKRRRCFHGSFCRDACGILVHIDWINWICVYLWSALRVARVRAELEWMWMFISGYFSSFFWGRRMCNKSTPKPTKLKHMRTASSCTVASLFLQQILHHFLFVWPPGRGWEERQQFGHGRGSWSPQHVMSLFVGGKPIPIADRSTSWKHRKLAGFCLLHWFSLAQMDSVLRWRSSVPWDPLRPVGLLC